MNTEIRRDMQHNYFIISDEMMSYGTFQNKMLEYNHLKGFLPYSLQSIDTQRKLYYEISGLQQLSTVIQRFPMSNIQTVKIMQQIMELIKVSGEYLLKEQDIVLDPEYMFIRLPSYDLSVCYYPGYQQPLRQQLSRMLEFFMSNVDYEDKEAVLLSYSLYMKSKEETSTIRELIDLLNAEPQNIQPQSNQSKNIQRQNTQSQSAQSQSAQLQSAQLQNTQSQSMKPQNIKSQMNESQENQILQIPSNKTSSIKNQSHDTLSAGISSFGEKSKEMGLSSATQSKRALLTEPRGQSFSASVPAPSYYPNRSGSTYGTGPREEEKEILFFPVQMYLLAGLVVLAAAIIILFLLSSGILKDSLTGKIPPVKLVISFIIIILPCAYAMLKIFSAEHKQSRMVSTLVYPSKDLLGMAATQEMNVKEKSLSSQPKSMYARESDSSCEEQARFNADSASLAKDPIPLVKEIADSLNESDQLPKDRTVLLNQSNQTLCAQLIPEPGSELEPILLSEFPFYIGTVKNRMNYSLVSPVISRYHAKVDKEGNNYYLTDLNSTNGTFLNGARVKAEEPNLLVAKDKISLANINFEFACPSSNFFL